MSARSSTRTTSANSLAAHATPTPPQLDCPTLVLIGQQEYDNFEASREWAHRCVDEATSHHKRLIVTPTDEGAATHAIGTNLSLMSQLVFDWLDDVFDDESADRRMELHEQANAT